MRKKKIQFISKYRSSSLLHEPFKITLGLSYEKCVSCEKSLPKGTHCWRRFDDYNPVSHWCLPCGNIKFETTEPVINSPKVNTQPKKESRPKKNKKPKKPGIFSKIFAEKIQTPGKNDNDDLEKISGKEWPNILNMEIAIENIKNTTLDNDLQNLKIELVVFSHYKKYFQDNFLFQLKM